MILGISGVMVSILIHEWVTGGGLAGASLPRSWAAEGAAMRRALGREFASLPDVRVTVTIDDRLPPDAGPWQTVRVGEGEEPEVFEALARRSDYTLVVAPETGGVLAERATMLERCSCRSLGATAAAVTLTSDKFLLERFLTERGIATPPVRLVSLQTGLPSDHVYPAVLKPMDGAGSLDTFLISGPGALPDAVRAFSPALLQPYVRGIPLSASFLAGGASPRLLGVGRQEMVIRKERFYYEGGALPAPRRWLVPDVPRAIAAIEGLRGFVGVDFVYDPDADAGTVIEINPRPTTSIVGLLGLLPAGRLARAWLDGTGELDALVHAQAPLRFRPDGTFCD